MTKEKFEYSDTGFKFLDKKINIPFLNKKNADFETNWDDIRYIIGYVEDLFSTDQLRLKILTTDDSGLIVNEDMNGWTTFLETMAIRLSVENLFMTLLEITSEKKSTVIYPKD